MLCFLRTCPALKAESQHSRSNSDSQSNKRLTLQFFELRISTHDKRWCVRPKLGAYLKEKLNNSHTNSVLFHFICAFMCPVAVFFSENFYLVRI